MLKNSSTLACIIRPFSWNVSPFGRSCDSPISSTEFKMAATATFRLGDPVGCSSTDTRQDEAESSNDEIDSIPNNIWNLSASNSPQTPRTPTYLVKTKPSSTQRYKLIHEGDIQLCRLNHTRTIVSKIMNSKYLRRWESHHVLLEKNEIKSSLVSNTFMFYPSHVSRSRLL